MILTLWLLRRPTLSSRKLIQTQCITSYPHKVNTLTLSSLGHVYAAGGLLALAHDYRIMREERGWFCLPEINLPLPFTVSMIELAK